VCVMGANVDVCVWCTIGQIRPYHITKVGPYVKIMALS
jgi:hypothetical protein